MATVSMADKAKAKADTLTDEAEVATGASASDIQAELDNLRRDIAALTQTLASFGSGKIKEASNRAGQLGAEAADASAQYVESARSSIAAAEQDLEAHIRRKPLQSIAIAAGVGFLAALLSRR
ncbi:MAG: YqjD family protein [Allorhizobium sp.]